MENLDYAVVANDSHSVRVNTWTEGGVYQYAILIDGVERERGSLE
jgi:hypothetical protein